MHWILEKTEKLVDKLVPYALFVLLILIILEFSIDTSGYETPISIIDDAILVLFIADLCFKYHHVKTNVQFFKTYWIEIIAVFPFYLLIRAYTTLLELSRGVEETQKVLHETALVREAKLIEEGKLLREARVAEEEARLLRETRLLRMLRFVQRSVRILFARILFTGKLLFHVRKKKKR